MNGKSVDSRHYYGDWEGDFIVSGKDGSGALLVLVERKSRYVIIWKLPDRKIATVNAVLKLSPSVVVTRHTVAHGRQ